MPEQNIEYGDIVRAALNHYASFYQMRDKGFAALFALDRLLASARQKDATTAVDEPDLEKLAERAAEKCERGGYLRCYSVILSALRQAARPPLPDKGTE